MKILLATGNRHKVAELIAILNNDRGTAGFDFVSLADFPDLPEVVEDGQTLEDNAVKKAVTGALATGLWALADDTGLEVPALNGAPGVYSARYAGPNCDFQDNCNKLLSELEGKKGSERDAAFRCVVALSTPAGIVRISSGKLEGRITESAAGGEGFGYDPIFLVTELGKTLAEISADEKNAISHRWAAVRGVRPWLEEIASGVQ
ncbi:MAG: non-canonical purine NTP pyrophosphatase, RdgB/HAM1 family [Elusimicrobia bacterium]|nr:MAG: non-canonical purine NTP pyrophosphatase, RdgB/HAM1 family [Elusimicrobiota bacterium]